jgi:hypothetical protein
MNIRRITNREMAMRRERGRARDLCGVLLDLEPSGGGVILDIKDWGTDARKAMHQLHTTRARVQARQDLLRSAVFRSETVEDGILIWRTA